MTPEQRYQLDTFGVRLSGPCASARGCLWVGWRVTLDGVSVGADDGVLL